MVSKVFFNYSDRKLHLKHKKAIKRFISEIFGMEKKNLEVVHYVFCSDEYLLKINKKFLHHNTYTDIITFDLSENQGIIKGEIYISVDRVVENAGKYHTSIVDEFLRTIFHGALHLCGYKDKNDFEKKTMRSKEDFYLNMFHVEQLQQ